MQPPETAFDRVKSLLGKMDRSIDDARRRRLDEPDPDHAGQLESRSQTEHNDDPAGHEPRPQQAISPPARPTSKYGRARPLRDVANGSGTGWQTARP